MSLGRPPQFHRPRNQRYFAYGRQRDTGPVSTEHKFTGQKQDGTGLQYFNARALGAPDDPSLGTFLSPDTIVPDPSNVMAYNRFMFVLGNPLKFNDPSGHTYEEGARYYWIDGYGLIDATHIHHGINRINLIRSEVAAISSGGGGNFTMKDAAQRSDPLGSIDVAVEYSIAGNLTESEINQVALAIAMNYELQFETYQSPGSSFSVEDLPSDYLGYYIGLNPGATIREALFFLGDDETITSLMGTSGEVQAEVIKLTSSLNYGFRPLPGVFWIAPQGVDWPSQLQMTSASADSGTWNALSVDVTEDTRTWFEKASDFGQTVWEQLK